MTRKTLRTVNPAKVSGTEQDEVFPLGRYLDGLTVSVYGRMYERVLRDLDRCQKSQWDSTRSSGPYHLGISVDDPPTVGTLWMQDYGHDGYQYHLDNEYLNLRLAGKGYLPALHIKFKARLLYHLQGSSPDLGSIGCVGDIASEICVQFLEEVQGIKVSECAVAVDFQGYRMQIPQIDDKVGRPQRWYLHGSRSTVPTGLTLGKQSKRIEFQIYNKSIEIEKSKKLWMHEFWSQHEGYSESSTVYRVEFRFRRESLSEFRKPNEEHPTGINTLEDLENNLGALLQYAVGDESQGIRGWIRFCTPESRKTKNGNDTRSSHRPTAPWWKTVAAEFINGTTPSRRVRIRPGSSYSPEYNRKSSYSCLLKWAAESWIDDPERFPAMNDFVAYALRENFYSMLEFRGTIWEQAVREKAHELQRKGYYPGRPFEEAS